MKNVISKEFKEEFQLNNCGFDHVDQVESMVQSQWQSRSQSIIYLIYRWIIAVIVTYTIFSSFYHHIKEHSFGLFFIYLTRWGIFLNMTVGIYGLILVAMWHHSSNYKENLSKTKEMPTELKIYWALHNVALTIAIVITIVYWALIFDDTTPLDQVTIMSHVVNSVIMLVDVCVVAYPLRVYHFIQPVCLGITYSIFTYIYYVCGGVNIDGERFIYKVLKWDESTKTLMIICGTLILCIMVHMILFVIYKLRVFIQSRCCFSTVFILPTTSENNAPAKSSTDSFQMTTVAIENGYKNQGFE